MLIAKNMRLKWMGYARADFDEATARLARRAGMETTYVGIESMDDATLELMNKRRTAADNISALRALLDAGIRVRAGFIPGFPGTSREAVRRTASVLGRLQCEYRGRLTVNAEPFTPYAGQPILNSLGEYGLSPVMWSDEILNIAPAYRDVTESIIEKVTGASQGLDRLGMQREVRVIASAGEGTDGEADDVFVTRRATEDLHDRRLAFEDIGDGLWLARFKSEDAVRECLVYSHEEKKEYERAMLFDGTGGAMRSHVDKIRQRHLAPSIVSHKGFPVSLGPLMTDVLAVVLSPFAVIRRLDHEFLVIDRFSKHRMTLELIWGDCLLALLKGVKRSDLIRAIPAPACDKASAVIDAMCSRGLLVSAPILTVEGTDRGCPQPHPVELN